MRSKLITNQLEMFQVIAKCEACYVSMVDQNNKPYVVPYNFGIKDDVIYLHSAQSGKKMDILRQNNNVCIAFSTDHQLKYQHESVACSYAMKFRSVIVTGRIEFIEAFDEKIEALNIIMSKYTDRKFSYGTPAVNEVCTYKVIIDEITGRKLGY